MGLLRLLVTGAAVAAGVHYATKKRPDGSSLVDDLKAKAPEWKDKAQPYINQVKDHFSKLTGDQQANPAYPNKFDSSAPDQDTSYSS